MNATFLHYNFNVLDLDRSIAFYKKALGFTEKRRKNAKDGSFVIVFLTDGQTGFELELTWLADRKEPYDLGDKEFHICYRTDDYEASLKHHQEMGCVVYVNEQMGIYFITDPDGYWVEITPER